MPRERQSNDEGTEVPTARHRASLPLRPPKPSEGKDELKLLGSSRPVSFDKSSEDMSDSSVYPNLAVFGPERRHRVKMSLVESIKLSIDDLLGFFSG